MKIGIFGGSFDPFSLGHLEIVSVAAKKLDKVFIVPTICDYYRKEKHPFFTFKQKCTIITTILMKYNVNGDISIDTVEEDKDSKWRTINTVEYFKKKFPNDELYLIIGQDSYESFKTWFRFDDLFNLTTLMVVPRSEEGVQEIKGLPCETLDIGTKFIDTSATKIREKISEEAMDNFLSDLEWYNGITGDCYD